MDTCSARRPCRARRSADRRRHSTSLRAARNAGHGGDGQQRTERGRALRRADGNNVIALELYVVQLRAVRARAALAEVGRAVFVAAARHAVRPAAAQPHARMPRPSANGQRSRTGEGIKGVRLSIRGIALGRIRAGIGDSRLTAAAGHVENHSATSTTSTFAVRALSGTSSQVKVSVPAPCAEQ